LEVRLLGPFEVIVAGKPVEIRGAKRQALVAYLALRAGRVVATDSLADALWGSDLPAAPRNAVQHHVTRLRRTLGPEAIRLAADGYALESRSCLPMRAPRCARAILARPRRRFQRRWLSGAALRCSACRSRRGRMPTQAG
jgi:DNA-binding SARP family transcriptional activator